MIGSLPVVYPWKEVLPGMYDYSFHLPPMTGELVLAIVMAVIGAVLVFVLSHLSKKKEERLKFMRIILVLMFQMNLWLDMVWIIMESIEIFRRLVY